ncbi:MAG TPA: hypothetical protein ENH87_00485 [Pricia antarctica]|uniref:Uncharacterized protein n=1 Tax=Pricia antarctica TaxID=641691 RepID=A0A831VTC9_9FLAO|nr:hypothetical protein [Pricia antarctica]
MTHSFQSVEILSALFSFSFAAKQYARKQSQNLIRYTGLCADCLGIVVVSIVILWIAQRCGPGKYQRRLSRPKG